MDGKSIDCVIDGEGRRVGKVVNGSPVQGFLYKDKLNPVAELDGDGNVVSSFIYGEKPNVPAYMQKNHETYRLISDRLGSVRLVVDVSTGQIVQRMDYDSFGNVLSDTNPGFQPFSFAGGMYDNDSQLVHFGKREYGPSNGRWIAKDPVGFSGGHNLYGYVLADPINLRDPSGEAGVFAAGAVDLAVIYGVSHQAGGYLGTGGAGTYAGASATLGYEIGADGGIGLYTGDKPIQATKQFYWGVDLDFGSFGIQFYKGGNCGDWSFEVNFGPGTQGVTITTGGANVSF